VIEDSGFATPALRVYDFEFETSLFVFMSFREHKARREKSGVDRLTLSEASFGSTLLAF
jgi:hypothetical protein